MAGQATKLIFMLNSCFGLPMKRHIKGQEIINISKKCLNDFDFYDYPISTLWYELKSHPQKFLAHDAKKKILSLFTSNSHLC